MAELVIGRRDDKLQALGLGSCIGLILYDQTQHIGGLVHIMLPDSQISRDGNPILSKYADTAVPELFRQMLDAGCQGHRLKAIMAGGAEMFVFAGKNSPRLAVGQRNCMAVREQLEQLKLKPVAADVGGNYGRTLEMDLNSLEATVKIAGKTPYTLAANGNVN